MLKVDGKCTTKKIAKIICNDTYLEMYRALYKLSTPGFKGFVQKDTSEAHDLRGYYYCKSERKFK